MKISIKSLTLQNFKGCKERKVDFGNVVTISGKNASGKTTIFDAITWLLFGKNSAGVEKFDLRPLDENGKQIDFVEISVSAVIDVDGKETELSKRQKQNWVKPRGAENQVFQGNVNEYSIDGFPKSEKEYKAFIESIIDADLFKMLTNPLYFPNMDWKKQREILMRFASTKSDAELATELTGFDKLIPDLEKASTDDIQKKYAKALKELKSKQSEIPVRIDELEKQKSDVDLAELELLRNTLKEEIKVKNGNDKDYVEMLRGNVMELDFKINEYVRKANESIFKARTDANDLYINAKHNYRTLELETSNNDSAIEMLESKIKSNTITSASLGNDYKAEMAKEFNESEWVFDEKTTICKMCGQKLPDNQIEILKAKFEMNKANAKKEFEELKASKLKALKDKGFELKDIIDKAKSELATLKEKQNELVERMVVADANAKKEEKKLNDLPERADLSNDADYNAMIAKKEELLQNIEKTEKSIADAKVENIETLAKLDDVENQISKAMNNNNIDERITELKEEQKVTAQKVADAECMVYLLETFVKKKLDLIASAINGKFNVVNFKLFAEQINGGMSECCECTVNGVPFSSLNSGHKIVAGLDICKTLSEVYEKEVFIVIDNAETLNVTNIPAMDNQLIRLCVTEDKELVIESK